MLVRVIQLKSNKDVLSSILKITQMGQVGIRSALKAPLDTSMQFALESQLKEYDSIEREALAIATFRGWNPGQLEPIVKGMTNLISRIQLSYGNTNSKTAAIIIQGNTRGMIKGLKNTHQCHHLDERISLLSQKLLDCEVANIRQMQGYL